MKGYKKNISKLLEDVSARIGDKIRVEKESGTFEGLLMPGTESGDSDCVVVKLENGYNIGLKWEEGMRIDKMEEGREPEIARGGSEMAIDDSKPRVTILGTGGTVASRIDYRTGAVHPAFSASEIYNTAPEIADIANIKTETTCSILSENMTPELWTTIGKSVVDELNGGADGVVIAHGTDTMGYTASALSFMLKNLSKPVVLVGSQRSSDRPSSDAALNLVSAVSAAVSDLGEVSVVMHGSMEDKYCLIHRGTKVRKCHASRRDAFQTVNGTPLGTVENGEVNFLSEKKGRTGGRVKLEDGFEEKVALIKTFPGISSGTLDGLIDRGTKGIILEGTGLGHTPESLYQGIERAIQSEIPVAMTSQCIWGRVNMKVYSTGRELLDLGVFSLQDMLPETALVKMMWVLDKVHDVKEVRSLMKKNIAGEITDRTKPDDFLKSDISRG